MIEPTVRHATRINCVTADFGVCVALSKARLLRGVLDGSIEAIEGAVDDAGLR